MLSRIDRWKLRYRAHAGFFYIMRVSNLADRYKTPLQFVYIRGCAST